MKYTYIAIAALSSLVILIVITARQFDKHIYNHFLQNINSRQISHPESNLHLFKLGLWVICIGTMFYGLVGLLLI